MSFESLSRALREHPRRWLVTGVAGFIGSNLLELLLALDQTVVGLDDFSTGSQRNLDEVVDAVGPERAARFSMIAGDVRDLDTCARAAAGVDLVLHQAAIGSVPRSIDEPLLTHAVNVTGFVNVVLAARAAGAKRVVYASSSAVYGDSPHQPNREHVTGRQLSPYAASKLSDELYAQAFCAVSDAELVGLRYFNVFGPRQDPNGPYAAVIPRWIETLLQGAPCRIFGDGETTRDFCHVRNVAEANVLAACAPAHAVRGEAFNVGGGAATTLNALYGWLHGALAARRPQVADLRVAYEDFRPGDIRHSVADIAKVRAIGFEPRISVADGLVSAIDWYIADAERRRAGAR